MVTIISKVYCGIWFVGCSVELTDGTRIGTESVSLPEEATDDELKAAIVAAYQ